ncbi:MULTISPECIES: DUF29 family protein [Cysteiniphilum]|uniref:DUF29 family protein n=1 Tax=Cysteiniphilum TaxID=2056696 RepID=UPI000E342693|nr:MULTISPECIES: DUF29 family protein [Cysteiniphilum]
MLFLLLSLQSQAFLFDLAEVLDDVYGDAILAAQKETGLAESEFPACLPYTLAQLLDDEFYP